MIQLELLVGRILPALLERDDARVLVAGFERWVLSKGGRW